MQHPQNIVADLEAIRRRLDASPSMCTGPLEVAGTGQAAAERKGDPALPSPSLAVAREAKDIQGQETPVSGSGCVGKVATHSERAYDT